MPALTDMLVQSLTEQIVAGDLRPGDRLPTEGELVSIHGVSRTVVREAMSRLNAKGLIDTQHGRGSFVLAGPSMVSFTLDPTGMRTSDELAELLQFRLGFEVEASGIAAGRASSAKIAGIESSLTRFTEAQRPSDSIDADFQFHRAIASASANRYFVKLLDSLGRTAIAVPRSRLAQNASDHHVMVALEHATVYRAIARHDVADARAAMRVHLTNSKERITS